MAPQRRSAGRVVAIVVMVLGISGASAGPALAVDFFAFSPHHPFYSHVHPNGRITNQINYRSVGGPRMQWSYVIKRPLAAAATTPATEVATLSCNGKLIPGYRDLHSGVPAGYFFHSSYGPLRTSCLYRLHIRLSFGLPGGIYVITVDHDFYITYT